MMVNFVQKYFQKKHCLLHKYLKKYKLYKVVKSKSSIKLLIQKKFLAH